MKTAYKAIEEVQADVAGCKQDIEATPAIEGLLLKERRMSTSGMNTSLIS